MANFMQNVMSLVIPSSLSIHDQYSRSRLCSAIEDYRNDEGLVNLDNSHVSLVLSPKAVCMATIGPDRVARPSDHSELRAGTASNIMKTR